MTSHALRSLAHTSFLVSIVVAGSIQLPNTASAQERVYEIAEFKARLTLGADGSYRIREEITYDFRVGSFTFGVRDIPLSDSDGVGPVRVSSPDVSLVGVTQEEEGDYWRVRWEFPPSAGAVTFVLDYELRGALREVDETNEVFWRVVGSGWEVPFRVVEAEVVLPGSLPVSSPDLLLDPAEIASVRTEGDDLIARFLPGPLPAGRAYQVKVSFPKVMAGRAVGLDRTENQALLAGFLSFLLCILVGGIVAYRRVGPQLPVRRQTHVDMDLPTAAVLLHRDAPGWDRAFPATLFDLADRGVITLERVDRKKGWITTQKVRLHRNEDGDGALTPFEAALLEEVGAYEDLDEFATAGKKFRKKTMGEVRDELVRTGHFVDLRTQANRRAVLALVVGAAAVATFIGGAATASPWWMALAGAGLGVSLGTAIVASVRFSRSPEGADRVAELRGYLEGVREELAQTIKRSPIGAAEYFYSVLPWLTLDPKYSGSQGQKIARLLKKETGELRALPWAVDRTKAYEKVAGKFSGAHAAFVPVLYVAGGTSGAVAPSAGGGVGGAAGGGAAGGGGGGAG